MAEAVLDAVTVKQLKCYALKGGVNQTNVAYALSKEDVITLITAHDPSLLNGLSELSCKASELLRPLPVAVPVDKSEREALHHKLVHEGLKANAEGNIQFAFQSFQQAHALTLNLGTCISMVNMLLKLGNSQLAEAAYVDLLQTQQLSVKHMEIVQIKLKQAQEHVISNNMEKVAASQIQAIVRGNQARRLSEELQPGTLQLDAPLSEASPQTQPSPRPQGVAPKLFNFKLPEGQEETVEGQQLLSLMAKGEMPVADSGEDDVYKQNYTPR